MGSVDFFKASFGSVAGSFGVKDADFAAIFAAIEAGSAGATGSKSDSK